MFNGNYDCRHSDETTNQGKTRLAAQNHRTAEVIPLSADELSGSVGHSCGVDYNYLAEMILILHVHDVLYLWNILDSGTF